MKKDKILITSALPYVNNQLHIGHLIGSFLPADIYARFQRAMGKDVLFVCGADEHGTTAVVGAQKENLDINTYVDKYRAHHQQSMNEFNISLDGGYGRTHSELQTKLVQSIFTKLDEQGLIEERVMQQPFSVDDNMFLADRQIEGTCPKCGYEKARGDQCDKCGELLDPKDLINPYSTISGSRNIEMRETKHLFFKASLMVDKLKDWIDSRTEWSNTAIAIANKWLDEGILDTSITRDLSWGVPVNKPGYENKVFYVWFDAPWGYVSISQSARPNDWETWWKNKDCYYAQFMGKDNVKFHSVFFPEQELAANDNWKTVDKLKGLNFLNFEGKKISKSNNWGIFLNQAITDAPSDTWRYALLSSAPETDDTDFTIQRFADIVNKDLNGMLGNFVSRVTKLTEKNFGLKVPKSKKLNPDNLNFTYDEITKKLEELTSALEACEFRKAIESLRSIWAFGNEFFSASEPWSLIKNRETEKAEYTLNNCFQLIDFYARVSAPFIPDTAKKIQNIFGGNHDLSWPESFERRIADGEEFKIPENLFTMIDADKIAAMNEKYKAKK